MKKKADSVAYANIPRKKSFHPSPRAAESGSRIATTATARSTAAVPNRKARKDGIGRPESVTTFPRTTTPPNCMAVRATSAAPTGSAEPVDAVRAREPVIQTGRCGRWGR